MGYVEAFLSDGVKLTPKQAARLSVLCRVYEQQQYMYENNTHTVPERIVSISQPYIRPIVRGKAAAPVEFGAKLDLSIDENGMARLGRPGKNAMADKKTEYSDNADRVEIERAFSLAKRCYGLGKIMTKLDTTTRGSIALSSLAMNVDRLASLSLLQLLISLFSWYKQHGFMLTYM